MMTTHLMASMSAALVRRCAEGTWNTSRSAAPELSCARCPRYTE